MPELKEVLGEELATKVTEKLGDKHGIILHSKEEKYILDDGKMVPKSRLDEVIAKRTEYQNLLEERDNQLKDLKKKAEGNDKLVAQISELQEANKESKKSFEAEQLKFRKQLAVKEGLLNAGVSESEARDLLVNKFDLTKVNLTDDDKVVGFDDLVKPLKESKAFSMLFGSTVVKGQEHAAGKSPEVNKLESELAEATKKNDLVTVIRLKREIAAQNNKQS